MDGYIIVSINEETGEFDQYWNGSNLAEDIANSHFYSNLTEARINAGNLQASIPTSEFRVAPAKLAVILATSAPTPAVTPTVITGTKNE